MVSTRGSGPAKGESGPATRRAGAAGGQQAREGPKSTEWGGGGLVRDVLWMVAAGACIKVLMVAGYRSTDFEVHRNWLAITSSLPLSEWYYSEISEWTLDYPPLFAWFERALAVLAPLFDPKMLELTNLNYASDATILFQRLTVVFSELVLVAAFLYHVTRRSDRVRYQEQVAGCALAVFNGGLLLTDHVHFQYNGMLLGLLVASLSLVSNGHDLLGGLLFAVLINMKHLFLSLGPVYFIFLLRHHCITPPRTGCWCTAGGGWGFVQRISALGGGVVGVFAASLGPLVWVGGIEGVQQLFVRLFPFGRGLCHAYWAPNVWVAYNIVDKILVKLLGVPWGVQIKKEGHMTGGIVGDDAAHAWLPTVTPGITVLLSVAAMLPALNYLWGCQKPRAALLPAALYCANCAFLFGYHVHEKASLTTAVPLILMALKSPKYARVYRSFSNVVMCQLMPLLFRSEERALRLAIWALHAGLAAHLLPQDAPPDSHDEPKKGGGAAASSKRLGGTDTLRLARIAYEWGLVLVLEPLDLLQPLVLRSLPFLPLLARSAYCLPGMLVATWELLMIMYEEGVEDARFPNG